MNQMQLIQSNLGFKFKVNTPYILNDKMREKLQAAVDIASLKLDSKRLKPFIDNFFYQKPIYSKKLLIFKKIIGHEAIKGFYIDTPNDIFNCSSDKILEIIQNANELILNEGKDCEADIYWKLDFRSNNSVVGYTYPNIYWQSTYQNWFNNMTPQRLAGHLVHEWLHKLGGQHSFKNHALREFTPVYAIGNYVSS